MQTVNRRGIGGIRKGVCTYLSGSWRVLCPSGSCPVYHGRAGPWPCLLIEVVYVLGLEKMSWNDVFDVRLVCQGVFVDSPVNSSIKLRC
jgi:hypothetical protein